LRQAALAALSIPREAARAHALGFTWKASAQQFLENIAAAHGAKVEGQLNPWRPGKERKLFGKSETVQL
jgi:hypothetical protein